MIYKANELLAKCRLLTLAGYEDGELIWVGSDKMWGQLPLEEESIIRDWELAKI